MPLHLLLWKLVSESNSLSPGFLIQYSCVIVLDEEVSPKAAAEEIGYTFLPCVLAYLHRAPNLIRSEQINYSTSSNCISAKDVDAVVVPVSYLALNFISFPVYQCLCCRSIMPWEDQQSCPSSLKGR